MKTYDFKKVQLVVGAMVGSGFAEGTGIKVGRNAAMWTLEMGADGEGTRSKSNDKSGYIEITLKNSSAFNAYLSSLALADETNNSGVVPTMVKDGSGASLHMATESWLEKMPDTEYGKVVGETTWKILTDELQMFSGGN